jgi:hypothetical protein
MADFNLPISGGFWVPPDKGGRVSTAEATKLYGNVKPLANMSGSGKQHWLGEAVKASSF